MKRLLSLAVLLCSLFLTHVNGQIGFVYQDRTYQNGDTLVVVLAPNAHQCQGIFIKNVAPVALTDLTASLTPIEENGIEAWGICANGQCVSGLTSSRFSLAPNAIDNSFAIDIDISASVQQPYGVYTLTVSNSSISSSIVLRMQTATVGIAEATTQEVLSAYPNPAQSQLTINYNTNKPATLAIFDMQGRSVRQFNIFGEGSALVDNLPAGIYTYGILGSNNMKKLIVK